MSRLHIYNNKFNWIFSRKLLRLLLSSDSLQRICYWPFFVILLEFLALLGAIDKNSYTDGQSVV